MPEKRSIPDDVIDALVEWCAVHAPCVLDVPGFLQGLFVITDDAIREAVEEERARVRRSRHQCCEN